MAAAQGYASAARRDHTGAGNASFTERMRAAGCQGGGMAENLAFGASGLQQALATWQGSPQHRTNLFNPAYRVYGLGQAGGTYVLMLADRC
jgi:uncharacterized protein YkwD